MIQIAARMGIGSRQRVEQLLQPEKDRARDVLNRAVRAGHIVRPKSCQECGDEDRRLHGHHSDYSRPLDVEWLCPGCHPTRHVRARQLAGLPRTLVLA